MLFERIYQQVLWLARRVRGQHQFTNITTDQSCSTMDVHIIPALSDNYMYLVVDRETKDAAVVDPVEPDRILPLIKEKNLNLRKVLTTHHHWDHAGGNKALVKQMPDVKVFGGENRVDACTNIVKHGDQFNLGSLRIECLFTPCHTKGHICYKISSDQEINLFTGDTLFVAGCGKFFEGTAEQMNSALNKIIGSLPGHTKIYCGHEYTLSNLKFAKFIDPDNKEIDQKIDFAKECQQRNQPTVPSTLDQEKLYNPFMRVNEAVIQARSKTTDPIETMRWLREEKNRFKASN
ncbi:Hydroxyacylglutathione hydrolase [Sarcoptes scabiei]|nr:Hydroxyacylglutathione hydrolase [Sarcoptes scabiei]